MKKSLIFVIILVLALCFAACADKPEPDVSAPTEQPTEIPTDEPTEEPTEAPTEEPTEAPTPEQTESPAPTAMPTEVPVTVTPLPEGDFFLPIRSDLPYIVDMDGDGEDDIVLVRFIEDEEDEDGMYGYYLVTINRACRPDEPYEFETKWGIKGMFGVIVDCDPSDAEKELLICFDDEGIEHTYAFRLKDNGSDFDSFYERCVLIEDPFFFDGLPEGFVYHADEGLMIRERTEILGTDYVVNHITVTSEGITHLSEEFLYSSQCEFKLKRDLKLKTDDGKTVTAKKGDKIYAYSTDMETYVKVKLENGTVGRAKVTFGDPESHYPVYINGVHQDEYADIQYAG